MCNLLSSVLIGTVQVNRFGLKCVPLSVAGLALVPFDSPTFYAACLILVFGGSGILTTLQCSGPVVPSATTILLRHRSLSDNGPALIVLSPNLNVLLFGIRCDRCWATAMVTGLIGGRRSRKSNVVCNGCLRALVSDNMAGIGAVFRYA